MLEFKMWLNIWLAENGATTANQKAVVFTMIVICILLFFYLLSIWLFKWRPFNKKFKLITASFNNKERFKEEIRNGGMYSADFDTSLIIRIRPYKRVSSNRDYIAELMKQ